LEHQHGRRFIVLEHQYGCCDVMRKRSICISYQNGNLRVDNIRPHAQLLQDKTAKTRISGLKVKHHHKIALITLLNFQNM